MEKISVKIDHKELSVNFWKTSHENLRGIFLSITAWQSILTDINHLLKN